MGASALPIELIVLLLVGLVAGVAFARLNRPVYPPCPACASNREVVPVVYGEPTRRTLHLAKQRRVSLGGYRLHDDDPALHCMACDKRFNA